MLAKVEEEIGELKHALTDATARRSVAEPKPEPTPEMAAEMGDLLFSLVNVARHIKVNPEESLRLATNRFTARFQFIEREAARSGRSVNDLSTVEMDHYWEAAKRGESTAPAEAISPLSPATEPTRTHP